MEPLAILILFASFWSLTAVGIYLLVVGLGKIRGHVGVWRTSNGREGFAPSERRLVIAGDAALLLLGLVLAFAGIFFSYMVVYGR